jgi:hypothetical protein
MFVRTADLIAPRLRTAFLPFPQRSRSCNERSS